MRTYRSAEEKKKIVQAINLDIEQGLTMATALERAGVQKHQYYSWKVARPKATEVLTVQVSEPSSQLIILVGNPADVHRALERLSQVGRSS